MDYRRTKYCPELIDVSQKKKEVEKLVEIEHPNAKDICLMTELKYIHRVEW